MIHGTARQPWTKPSPSIASVSVDFIFFLISILSPRSAVTIGHIVQERFVGKLNGHLKLAFVSFWALREALFENPLHLNVLRSLFLSGKPLSAKGEGASNDQNIRSRQRAAE
jgi:hypothetical protein